MKHTLKLLATLLLAPLAGRSAVAETYIVENGQPRAEVVISDKPVRTARLAAQELQDGIRKISGARLPIVTQPSGAAVKLFVGRSTHTDKLKVTADGLKDGAFRMVSGDDWLALLGEDTEFTPIEPWAKGHADITKGTAQQAWDTITGALWGMPNRLMFRSNSGRRAKPVCPTANASPVRSSTRWCVGALTSAVRSMPSAAFSCGSACAGMRRAKSARWCRA